VVRPYSHSLSDDEKLYKTAEEREEEAHRDPLSKFSLFLVREGLLDQKEIEALEADVDREVREAGDQALAAEPPSVDSISSTFILPTSIPPLHLSRLSRNFTALPKQWSKWLPLRSPTRWLATSASSFSAKMSPTASRDENLNM